jgi:Raf kinase inhibitor-like YbhB/YbcL family protein
MSLHDNVFIFLLPYKLARANGQVCKKKDLMMYNTNSSELFADYYISDGLLFQPMRIRYVLTIIFFVLVAVGAIAFFRLKQSPTENIELENNLRYSDVNINLPKNMKISSSAFDPNTYIPSKFTCDGENINPPLMFSGAPENAHALALIMDDPDASVSGGFVHWIVFNFDPKTDVIDENSAPANAVQGQNGAGQSQYTGPCPPSGTHHYHFKLYALDSSLDLGSSAKREDVERAMQGHILDQAELIGLYSKQ